MKKKFLLFLVLAICILTAWSNNKTDATSNSLHKSSTYKGGQLTIGVVGKAPVIHEPKILFENIQLKDLLQGNLSSKYKAVFIMKENLTEAATAPYAKVYQNSDIPFFFIESKKSYAPFIEANIDYNQFPDVNTGNYITG
ncbi:hypothetical protein [Neobacillus cucumis]|uniref:hypothetical protein n=1 Tax=Neobacillus cucumis TaxID=1740721 RepID=UPI0028534952|nr:hypothetical protein [Neobacillus cucumis]MDR4950419.1 hypothetical protein [Neobacillus cucumis]